MQQVTLLTNINIYNSNDRPSIHQNESILILPRTEHSDSVNMNLQGKTPTDTNMPTLTSTQKSDLHAHLDFRTPPNKSCEYQTPSKNQNYKALFQGIDPL